MSKKLIVADLHFGANNNDVHHNEDLCKFFDYVLDYAQENAIKDLYIAGDIFEHRDKINVNTLNYAYHTMKRLAQHFAIKAIPGNHDLYYKDTLDISSLCVFEPLMEIYDKPTKVDNILFVPWIISGEDYDRAIKISKDSDVDYMVAHFEFSGFLLNDHYRMEHGQTHTELKHLKQVFTGHFHMRQIKDNVIYIGTPFPYNFNDANDEERGFIVLDNDKDEWEWVNYSNVKVLSVDYKDFLDGKYDSLDPATTRMRVVCNDEVISTDTLSEVKEKLASAGYRQHKITYKSQKEQEMLEEGTEIGEIGNIDTLVYRSIENMSQESNIDTSLLLDLYKEAKEASA